MNFVRVLRLGCKNRSTTTLNSNIQLMTVNYLTTNYNYTARQNYNCLNNKKAFNLLYNRNKYSINNKCSCSSTSNKVKLDDDNNNNNNNHIICKKDKNVISNYTVWEKYRSNVDPYARLMRMDRPIGKKILYYL